MWTCCLCAVRLVSVVASAANNQGLKKSPGLIKERNGVNGKDDTE